MDIPTRGARVPPLKRALSARFILRILTAISHQTGKDTRIVSPPETVTKEKLEILLPAAQKPYLDHRRLTILRLLGLSAVTTSAQDEKAGVGA
ncbi:hypothetical protein [Celeribacter naphthalenivorans]|uniref:hypothetical protein n=1 Tax=Celeribacter naphthalenivorans TaxID=1614694 RepID=UPI001CFBF1F4|nr:hypothetical protein [Celeribacter naphthalenivorans]